ncbi:hypothetical protein M5E89_11320 [Acidaminococcus intestini]|nr:hypothetical protein M5E89_11320 [Acidaminococcus intestini]
MYMLCRCGIFDGDTPVPYEDSAMAGDAETYNQFQRSWTPYEGELDDDVSANAMAALLEKMGPSILVTHSMGGTIGWRTPSARIRSRPLSLLNRVDRPLFFLKGKYRNPCRLSTIPSRPRPWAFPLSPSLP